MTTHTDPVPDPRRDLVGHFSEHQRFATTLDSRPGLVALISDPFSGATPLLARTLKMLDTPSLYVDARTSHNETELADDIIAAAIRRFEPAAVSWWKGVGSPTDTAGLGLLRRLRLRGADLEPIRNRDPRAQGSLEQALRASDTLAGEPVVLALDHLDGLAMRPRSKERPLATLRAAYQASSRLQMVLGGRTEGPVHDALRDADHPLYRAGEVVRLSRAAPGRFVDDVERLGLSSSTADLVRLETAAELADGVPTHVWRVLELARQRNIHSAWACLGRQSAIHLAHHYDLLSAIHPSAQPTVTSLALYGNVYATSMNPSSVSRALRAMQRNGVIWQPKPRRWSIADPLLEDWIRGRRDSQSGT